MVPFASQLSTWEDAVRWLHFRDERAAEDATSRAIKTNLTQVLHYRVKVSGRMVPAVSIIEPYRCDQCPRACGLTISRVVLEV